LCQESQIILDHTWMRRQGHYSTTLKERICVIDPVAARIHQHTRCDRDTNMLLSAHDAEDLIGRMVEDDPFDFYVIADYNKGVFSSPYSPKLLNWLGHMACRKPLIVNSKKPERWSEIPMDALICNEKEIVTLKTVTGRSDNDLHGAVEADRMVITMSSSGVRLLHDPNGDFEIVRAETKAETVLDVTGAGDAFTAGFACELFRQSGTQPHLGVDTWLDRGSEWAAQCCEQIGCGRPNPKEGGTRNGANIKAHLSARRVAAGS
jgi:bifunctional ADP-heptose synthase (sugar kinase/adenylyltransferase)